MIRTLLTGLLTLGSLVNLIMLVLHHGGGTSLIDSLWLALLITTVGMSGLFRWWVRHA